MAGTMKLKNCTNERNKTDDRHSEDTNLKNRPHPTSCSTPMRDAGHNICVDEGFTTSEPDVRWDYEAEAEYLKLPPDKRRVWRHGSPKPRMKPNGKQHFTKAVSPIVPVRSTKLAARKRKILPISPKYASVYPRKKYNLKKVHITYTDELLQPMCELNVEQENTAGSEDDSVTKFEEDIVPLEEVEQDIVKVDDRGVDSEYVGERNESFTAFLNDEDDDFMVRCSQEIEQKMKSPPRLKCGNVRKSATPKQCKVSSSKDTEADTGNRDIFDDSFDALIVNFTEEDVERLSQNSTNLRNECSSSKLRLNKSESDRMNLDLSRDGEHKVNNVLSNMCGELNTDVRRKSPVTCSSLNVSEKLQLQVHTVSSGSNADICKLKTRNIQSHKLESCKSKPDFQRQIPSYHLRSVSSPARCESFCNIRNIVTSNCAPGSPPKCSPEEIEKKKQEAKKKLLERKKLCGKDRPASSSYPSEEFEVQKKKTSSSDLSYQSEIEKKRQIARMKLMRSRTLISYHRSN